MRKFFSMFLILSTVAAAGVYASQDEYLKGLNAAKSGDFQKAIGIWLPLAEAGDPNSQRGLGVMYQRGDGVKKDTAEAIKWLQLSANAGHPEAQYFLGYIYGNGDGVKTDINKAIKWYQSSAKSGHKQAQYGLGMAYYYGEGVEKDLAKAFELIQSSANQGFVDAQYALGFAYYNGEGVGKDFNEAFRWFEASALQKSMYGQLSLAIAYENGQGVGMNTAEAIKWYKLAADQGSPQAVKSLKRLERTLSSSNSKNQSDERHGVNMNLVNQIYGEGNYKKAVDYAQKLAVDGNAQAQFFLASMYEEGLGTLQLNKNAHMWYNISAMNGNSEAREKRNALTSKMTNAAIEEAQIMAKSCTQSGFKDCGIKNQVANEDTAKISTLRNAKIFLQSGEQMKVSFNSQSLLLRKQLQYALKKLGLYSSSIDGIWGRGTSQAITNYIKLNDLMPKTGEEVYMNVLSKVAVPNSFASNNTRSSTRNTGGNAAARAAQQRQADMLINLGTSLMNSSRGTSRPSRSIDCYTYGNYTTCN